MTSPDGTYYNIKRLHVVFAVSSLALLAVTAWMLVADHRRPWKQYQRTFRDRVEPWLTEARILQRRTEEYTAREQQLGAALGEARKAVPDRLLIRRFCEELTRDTSPRDARPPEAAEIEAACEALAAEPGIEARDKLLALLSEHVARAARRRESVDRQLQLRRAEFDEARSFYEAAVGEGLPREELSRLQERAERRRQQVEAWRAGSEEAAAHHEALTGIVGRITVDEGAARRALADHRAELKRLERALAEQSPSLGKQLLRLPVIDAFGRPLAIDQIWLPELTIDYNFRQVARFDRCTTCHQAIDKTVPGLPSEPACLSRQVFTVELAVPGEAPRLADVGENTAGKQKDATGPTLRGLYGFALAPQGILDDDAATIHLVLPRTPAADAGLLAGDVIQKIDGVEITSPAEARRLLLEAPKRLQPSGKNDEGEGETAGLAVEIGRGLPHPLSSHPRLDLFVGSLSPHPVSRFGCTICHEGQGSATEFKFASHTPNDPKDRARWRRQHGWYWNEHWDFPMRPRRFLQSSCLKCHHAVTDLAPSERFPDPPAPKLLAGYHLIRQLGCFGCHEIKGVAPSGERTGPDMRLEPNDPEAAAAVGPAAENPTPAAMRRVGPSLRDTAGKLDAVFLDKWLGDPSGVRPGTRMPQFYGMHAHLDGKSLDDAKRFEAVEIRAVTDYLLAASQPVEPLPAPPEVTEAPSAERGRELFLTQGCLACHKHDDFPQGESIVGANLSGLGSKLSTPAGRKWLVSWIRDPMRHSPRTTMPNTLLEPVPLGTQVENGQAGNGNAEEEAEGQGEAGRSAAQRMTDPAADIAAYLLESSDGGQAPEDRQPLVEADLDELVFLHLGKALSQKLARRYLEGGCELAPDEAQGDLVELAGRVTAEKKIRYVGRRTIRKRGCFGCHDAAGFEDAQPIGPALSDWGRKRESLLAFEQIHQLLANSGEAPSPGSKAEGSRTESADDTVSIDPDRDFYVAALLAHRREGFVWQKLRAPRSFDYRKTENKGYNERLTMGRFTLRPEEREAIITFVLGLVAEPPTAKYVYEGSRRRRAVVEGQKVLDKYGCAECHTLQMQRWQIEYDPEEIEGPYEVEDFAFVKPQIDVEGLEAQPDPRGLLHAEVVGRPQMDDWGEMLEDVDDDDNTMWYFNLWEPAALKVGEDWMVWPAGGAQLGISDPHEIAAAPPGPAAARSLTAEAQKVRPSYTPHLTGVRPPVGGAFARLLFPHVLSEDSPAVTEAWGWVPPPLVREGLRVEPAWLHDYLLEPLPVRPAAVLRMPKYNLSPAEAASLVDYFAAAAGVEFPYASHPRSRSAVVEAKERDRPNRLDDAMRIVTDRTTFCTKCHLLGDYSPGGEIQTTLGPRLDRVGGRIRPDYLRRWLANPKTLVPYTGMPVNFPPAGPPIGQDLYPGTSLEQLDAVVDLLLSYDAYMNRRTSIRGMIESREKAERAAAPEGN